MQGELDLNAIVARAKKKGYLELEDLHGLTLSLEEFRELHALLRRRGIPFREAKADKAREATLDQADARRIITKLRVGVPPVRHVGAYTVGRESLVSAVYADLDHVRTGSSRVRFLNGNYGRGKTHSLRLLREKALQADFVVSEVTLSPTHCPLHEFMSVYRDIMKGISTSETPTGSAIESILARWIDAMRELPRERVRNIVYKELPEGTKCALGAYYEAQNIVRPDARKRALVLKYLYGDRLAARDRGSLELTYDINEQTALMMLGQIAHLVRYIGYRGLCILLDEAESVHSFVSYHQRDRAFQNLQRITQESSRYPHCYFLYATTPVFFDKCPDYRSVVGELPVLELEPLTLEQRLELCTRIAEIHSTAYAWTPPREAREIMRQVERAEAQRGSEVSALVRGAVAALDELRKSA